MIYNIKTLKIGIPAAFSIDFQLTNDKKREKSSLRIVVNEGYHQNITLRILNSEDLKLRKENHENNE